jgi:DNA replication protein DnaC
MSGIPPDRKNTNFKLNFHPSQLLAATKTEELATMEHPSGFVLLAGPYGCGKSHLLVAAINAAVKNNKTALYIDSARMLSAIRSTFGGNNSTTELMVMSRFSQVRVLAIDELDRVGGTDWATATLFQIINDRYNGAAHGTGLDTRLTLMATNSKFKSLDSYLQSRLNDKNHASVYEMWGAPDFRNL